MLRNYCMSLRVNEVSEVIKMKGLLRQCLVMTVLVLSVICTLFIKRTTMVLDNELV